MLITDAWDVPFGCAGAQGRLQLGQGPKSLDLDVGGVIKVEMYGSMALPISQPPFLLFKTSRPAVLTTKRVNLYLFSIQAF